MRVVLDTVVFVRALLNPLSACGRVLFEHTDRLQLVLSQPILVEVLEVLQRPELTRRFSTLADRDPLRVLDILAAASVVTPSPVAYGSRDPSDDKFLATAAAAGATYLVSMDRDLLDLREYGSTRIVTCLELAALLEANDPPP
jgi:putative PIN family toxin of toxin-antitoxin system